MPPKQEGYIPSSERDDTKMYENMDTFCGGHALSGDEIETAYLVAQGIYEEKVGGENPRAEVFELAKMMDESMTAGFPVNRVIDLIKDQRRFEDAPNSFYELVNNLNTSDKEKTILRSIVENKRSGNLTVFDGNTNQLLYDAVIKFSNKSANEKNILAARLLKVFSGARDNKISLYFAPEE